MLKVQGRSKKLISDLMFLKYVFFVFILDAIFCGTNFLIFQEIFGLVKSSCCSFFVPFSSSTGLVLVAEANLRCGDFLSEKNVVTILANFLYFFILTTRQSLSFHKCERQSCLFGVDNSLFTC